jgi:predicted membrane protein
MENQEIKNNKKRYNKQVVGGAFLVIGSALLAKQMGVALPSWLMSWPMLLIVIGLASGIKNNFRNSGWLFMILVGGVFLAERINPDLIVTKYTWPVVLIGLGLWFIFGRHKKCEMHDFKGGFKKKDDQPLTDENEGKANFSHKDNLNTGDDVIDSVAVFGGAKKHVLSKNFKGGEIVTIMGGTEINLTHADIQGVAVLEVVQIFGGTKIIIPHGWEVSTEMAAIFAGIDDKRVFQNQVTDKSKVLVIKGTSVFGGIEIKSF